MYKALFFDVDDTLIDFGLSSKAALSAAFAELSMPYTEESERVFHEVNDEMWHRVEKGELTRPRLYETRFSVIFDRLGLSADAQEADRLFRQYLCEIAIPMENAQKTLAALSERYPIYAASNAPHLQQIRRLTGAGLIGYMKKVFTSDAIGASKPSREFFEACFAELPYRPDEVLMIGDSVTADVIGAMDFGMHACYFDRKGKGLPEGVSPELTVSTLHELCVELLEKKGCVFDNSVI